MKKRGVAVLAAFAALATGLVAGASASEPNIPTGGNLVYAGIDPADGMSDIYVKSTTGSTIANISHGDGTRKDGSPSFSPNGSKVAFVRGSRAGAEIMVVNPDGSGLMDVTPTQFRGASNLDPRWSGDGTRIVFASNVDGNYDLYWIDAVPTSARSAAHRLTKTAAPVRNLDPGLDAQRQVRRLLAQRASPVAERRCGRTVPARRPLAAGCAPDEDDRRTGRRRSGLLAGRPLDRILERPLRQPGGLRPEPRDEDREQPDEQPRAGRRAGVLARRKGCGVREHPQGRDRDLRPEPGRAHAGACGGRPADVRRR